MHASVRSGVIALGLIPLALLLSGCVGGPSLPNLPGNPGSDEVDDELVEEIVEGSGGEVDFESGALPADFPVDDVPLVPGEVGPSMSISGGETWTVTILAADEATANSAGDLLEQAGFSNDSGFAWENEQYLVLIVTTEQADDGRWQVYYQVQKQ
jgi:hypothetical protein